MILITLLIYALIFNYARRYDNFVFLPSFVFASILTVSQSVYWIFCNNDLYKYFKIGNLRFEFDYRVYLIHYIFLLINFFALYRLKNEESTYKKKTIRTKLKNFINSSTLFPLNTKTINIYIFIFFGMLFVCVYHFYYMPVNIWWSNNQYLLLSNASKLNLSLLAGLITTLSGVFAIQMLILMIMFAKSKRYAFAISLFPFFLYMLLLKLADNSRWAALIMFSALPFIYKKGSVKSYLLMVFVIFITFTFYLSALKGRNGSSYTQGISAIGQNIEAGYDVALILMPKIAGTAFSSSWNLDLTFKQFDGKIVTFDFRYKVLSFSPTISAIDHFDVMIPTNVLHILSFAPVGFMGELYYFGPVFFIIVCIFLWWALRYCNKIVIRHRIIGLLSVSPIYLFFFRMQGYAIRNEFRYIIVAVVFGFLVNHFQMKRKRRNEAKAKYPQLPAGMVSLANV